MKVNCEASCAFGTQTLSGPPGYTLIEMLIVMGIVLAMSTLALMSVTSMLRGTRMTRGVSLVVAAADESRTSAFTLRRSTRIDLTRINWKGAGDLNRLTVVGPFSNEDFEGYSNAAPGDPAFPDSGLQSAWLSNSGAARQVIADTSRTLLAHGGTGAPFFYWNPGYRGSALSGDDFEVVVEARIKILAEGDRSLERQVGILGCVSDSGGALSAGYSLTATIDPATTPGNSARNNTSTVSLNKIGGTLSGVPAVVDALGAPSQTCCLIEGVWYRFLLSIKQVSPPGSNPGSGPITLSGKIWADGQLEPAAYTIGPITDSAPLANGFVGVSALNCDALADDVMVDIRSIRLIPPGLRVDTFEPKPGVTDPSGPGDYALSDPAANPGSPYLFPIMFRPDGTCAVKSVIRISDMTSGDSTYVTINPNTGRAIVAHSLLEATSK